MSAALGASLLLVAARARAQPPADPEPPWPRPTLADVSIAAGGFVTGFLAHETGHLVANWAFGNAPTIRTGLAAGFVPFVFVEPRIDCGSTPGVCREANGDVFEAGRRGKFVIVTAGFEVQHVISEVLLDVSPDLRWQHAPFRKGLLAFNVSTSLFYAIASWTGIEDPRGDLANAARASGLPSGVIAAAIAVPAALDLARYLRPDVRWLPWASRASKGVLIGLTFAW
jgi:hypothetical protein